MSSNGYPPYPPAGGSRRGQSDNPRRSSRDAAAGSYRGQSNGTGETAASSSQNHAPQEEQQGPRGVNLTEHVQILDEPGHEFRMSIGDGGFSDVFKGVYTRPQSGRGDAGPVTTFVAVKLFRMSMNGGNGPLRPERVTQRILREANLWFRLSHPNIQPYLGYCENLGPSIALISPYCGNRTIMTFIANNSHINKSLLIKGIAKGLSYLHSNNVIHCDLNCNNVLVNESGHPVLTDFGRAKITGDVFYSTPLMAGTAKYMAPELLPLTDEVDIDELFSKMSDVYAFGILCFEIFTGEEPFACYRAQLDWQVVPFVQKGQRPLCTTRVQRCISQGMWAMMEACWRTAPEERPLIDQIVQGMH